MALAAMVAGASGQSLNGTGPAGPRQMTRGPPATQEDAEPTTVERGVEDDTRALSGDTMFALIAMCRERKWVLATDHAHVHDAGMVEGIDRFILTVGASAADGGGDGGHKGERVWERAAAPAPRCAQSVPSSSSHHRPP